MSILDIAIGRVMAAWTALGRALDANVSDTEYDSILGMYFDSCNAATALGMNSDHLSAIHSS